MKKVFLWTAFLLVFLGQNLWADLSYSEWSKLRRKFNSELRGKTEDAAKFIKTLSGHDDPRVAELIVEKALFHKNPQISLQAFQVLTSFKKERTIDKIIQIARRTSKDEHKFQLILVLGHFKGNKDLKRLFLLTLRDRDWRVASATLRSIQRAQMTSMVSVVKRYFRRFQRSNPRLAYEAAQTLETLSGEKIKGYDQGGGFIFPEKIYGQKVAFAIGTSQSMENKVQIPGHIADKGAFKKKKEKVASKLDLVKYGLEKSLQGLPSDSRFNIYDFSGRVRTWERQFPRARPSSIRNARRFIERMRTEADLDVYGAIKRIMDEKDVDTIYLVCDRLPQGGYYDDLEKVQSKILENIRPAFVNFHILVALDAPSPGMSKIQRLKMKEKNKKIATFYKDLAQASFGTYSELKWSLPDKGSSDSGSKTDKKEPEFTIKKSAGRISYREWRRVKGVFRDTVGSERKREKAKKVIAALAAADDPRAVDLLVDDLFRKDDAILIKIAIKNLQKCKAEKTIREVVTQYRRTRSEQVKLILLQAMGGFKNNSRVERELLKILRLERDWRLVSAALMASKTAGTSKFVDPLKKIVRKKNRRLSYEAAEALEAITGNRPSGYDKAGGLYYPASDSNHIVFAIPLSGRMGRKVKVSPKVYENVKGKKFEKKEGEVPSLTLLDAIRFQLLATLEKLPRKTEFTLVAYSAKQNFWSSRLKRSGSSSMRQAKRWLERLDPKFDRDLLGLHKDVRRIRDVDTVVIVADGLPKGGFVSDSDRIFKRICGQNLRDFLRIHTRVVLPGPADSASELTKAKFDEKKKKIIKYYRRLAEVNYGTFNSFTSPEVK